eukprot:247460-Pelagomonas_calceolata.AAC.1
MRGMAEGEAIVAHKEGVCVCPKDLITAACAEISVELPSNSRGLENLYVETMHHLCKANRIWGDAGSWTGGWMVAWMPAFLAASKASSRVLSLSTVSIPTHLPW